MTTKVELVEPWGGTDDYCGDGSCGVSNPDDTRFVLRYTVTVPKTFDGRFDPLPCPGTLHVANGNDADAYVSVAGNYAKPLDGTMLPGTTKYGVEEYSIEKKAINQTFYLDSTCGDVDTTGETVVWGGKIPNNTTAQLDDVGTTHTTKHFKLTLDSFRQNGKTLIVNVTVCARTIPSGFDTSVPVSTEPWTINGKGKTIEPSKGGTFKPMDLDKGTCNFGGINFTANAAQVTRVDYHNSLGEKATWK